MAGGTASSRARVWPPAEAPAECVEAALHFEHESANLRDGTTIPLVSGSRPTQFTEP